MKKYLLIFSAVSLTLTVEQAQAQVTFQRILQPPNAFGKVLQSKYPPYEYISFTYEIFGAYLSKYDTNNVWLWTKTYGTGQYVKPADCLQTSDGGFIIAGGISLPSNNNDGCLIKTDSNGNLLWTKVYGDTSSSEAFGSISQTNDGGYILAGSIKIGNGNPDAYIVKTDSSGNLLWTKYFGQTGANESPYDIIQTSNGGFLLTGRDFSNGKMLVRMDSIGNILWHKDYGAGNAYSIIQTTNGNFLLACQASAGFGPASLMEIDINGNVLWSKAYGISYENIYSINKTNDGGYICAGESSFGSGGSTLLLKVDSIGNLILSRIYGKQYGDYGRDAIQTRDGGYLILGDIDAYVFPGDPADGYLIKTDSLGVSGCNENNAPVNVNIITVTSSNIPQITGTLGAMNTYSITTYAPSYDSVLCASIVAIETITSINNIVTISPNPFSSSTTLQSDILFRNTTLTVYNSYGQQVKQIKNISGQEIKLQRDNLPSGLYFIRLTEGDKTLATDKLIIADN
ncbi:MAG: T9SS type A sorting domain-containing protein [Bacteroidetes bacterium]|nr:T9SS type A sorting domain-containing protein [Bacteroidota bacterium]